MPPEAHTNTHTHTHIIYLYTLFDECIAPGPSGCCPSLVSRRLASASAALSHHRSPPPPPPSPPRRRAPTSLPPNQPAQAARAWRHPAPPSRVERAVRAPRRVRGLSCTHRRSIAEGLPKGANRPMGFPGVPSHPRADEHVGKGFVPDGDALYPCVGGVRAAMVGDRADIQRCEAVTVGRG